ncbi:uncharacterized protein AB9W97_020214 isoform 2-T2 [Spinachia spinachia]
MMSYLWILLLGSLLAAGGEAQDDAAPAEEVEAHDANPAEEVEAHDANPAEEVEAPDANPAEEVEAPDTNPAEEVEAPDAAPAEEVEAPDAAPAEEVEAPDAAPAEEVEALNTNPAEEVEALNTNPAEEVEAPDTNPAEEVEAPDADPASDVTEESVGDETTDHASQEIPASDPETSAAKEEGPGPTTAADQEAEEAQEEAATTPQGPAADPEPEGEASTTPPGPAADPDVVGPKTEEEEKGATPAPAESGAEADLAVVDNEGKTTVPAVVDKVDPELEAMVPTRASNSGDALAKIDVDSKRRSSKSGTHVSGASGEDKPEPNEASSGSLAAILSAVGVSVVGAVVGYYTYQKKKLCFQNRQEADPEAARKADTTEAQSDPQVLSNLLNSS